MTREELMALADELESCGPDCDKCHVFGQAECRGDRECTENVSRYCARRIREIAGHDACEVTTVSAYDLLGDEDREALAWVRGYGGLEAVKASIHQGAMEHGCLLKVAEMLGTSIYDGTDNADALLDKLEKRLMPEGMEWPTVDGEPVVIGERMRSCGIEDCKVVGIDPANARLFLAFNDIEKGKAVYFPDLAKDCHRPAPKVLDADGVEIREGDVLYSVETGDYVIVNSIEPGNPWFATTDGALQHCAKFTHRAPVIAADGKPLEVGQTVYATHYGYVKCTVLAIEWVVDGYLVEVENEGGHKFRQTPDEFIHQRPVLDADGEPLEVGDHVWWTWGGQEYVVEQVRSSEEVYVTLAKGEFSGQSANPRDLTHQRPVLDADGVPLEVGQTVYTLNDDRPYTVKKVETNRVSVNAGEGAYDVWKAPTYLTHQRPVLDADGVPIREGDTLWRVNGDGPFTAIEYKKAWMRVKSEDGHVVGYWPDDLTHAKPDLDTWERIEEDARLMPSEYTDRYRVGRIGFEVEDMRVDLVRRARKLAEGGVR